MYMDIHIWNEGAKASRAGGGPCIDSLSPLPKLPSAGVVSHPLVPFHWRRI